MPRVLRWSLCVVVLLLTMAAVALGWIAWHLNNSLAFLEGEYSFAGLGGRVIVERDAQGIPSISATTREDTAFALGLLHAQERFFQMDLLRRNSAGELAELVGELAAEHDRQIRIHQFRKRADRALETLEAAQTRLLRAYTDGVNEGLGALTRTPFEYLLLQTEPTPWRPADSLLVLYSMYLDLQPEWNEHERSLAVMRDILPADWYSFFTPAGGEWDSPVHGERYSGRVDFPEQALAELQNSEQLANHWRYEDSIEIGSNNWSISGELSAKGAATVANDMHLGLNVPNIWYRASWYLNGDGRRVTGVTLPGTPAMVVGSNEHLAWGFTNSGGDYHDSIILRSNEDDSAYLTEDGWEDFDTETETVGIKDGQALEVAVQLTRWGPVIGRDHNGNLLALRWVAHDLDGANLNSLEMETADSVDEALDIAATAGIPGQNLNVVDRQGNQAWTIMGRLPRRFGFAQAGLSPTSPADWSSGELGWDGYLAAEEYPRVINPEHGRLWTANARIVSDDLLEKVGRGDYALGARQQQIEQGLFALDELSETDLLNIALDNRAVFLERWQKLLLAVLSEQALAEDAQLAELRDFVDNWEDRASTTSVGYLAVKLFRQYVIDNTAGEVVRHVESHYRNNPPKGTYAEQDGPRDTPFTDTDEKVFWPEYVDSMFEYPVWALVEQQPERHVPADYDNWPGFLKAMAVATLQRLTANGGELAEQTWGQANTLAIRHPLSQAVPMLSRWLDMPAEPMPGDTYMPLVQSPVTGASERMVVAPGHEKDGIFHMATGQSAHPLSPYYDKGHRDWVEGRPSPLLPGETRWRMTLRPE